MTAIALCAPHPALAQFSVRPDWAERPAGDQLSPHYPKIPMMLQIGGVVLLRCQVAATGVLERCSVESEEPKGLGFGPAALEMSRTFQMRPPVSVGAAKPGATQPDAVVRIPVRFKLPGGEVNDPPAVTASATQVALMRRLTDLADPLMHWEKHYEERARELEFLTVPGGTDTTGPAAASALRAAAETVLPKTREHLAAILARRMSETDLAAVVRFAETREGRAYLKNQLTAAAFTARVEAGAEARRAAAVRDAFCAASPCEAEPPLAQPDPDDPDVPLAVLAWGQEPTPLEQARAWPLSWMVGISGYAQLVCTIDAHGAPAECEVATESSKGVGLGAAALELANRYRVRSSDLPHYVGHKVMLLSYFAATERAAPPRAAVDPIRGALAAELSRLQAERWPDPDPPAMVAEHLETYPILDAGLRAKVAAAMLTGFPAWRAAMIEGRGWLLATDLDEATLRAALTFERGAGAAFTNAARDAWKEFEPAGQSFDHRISIEAAKVFCATRGCTPAIQGSGAPAGTPPPTRPGG